MVQNTIPLEEIRLLASGLFEETVRVRRDIHAHPELGFSEERTAGIAASCLSELGIEVFTGVAKTGVVGVLDGKTPGRTLLLRADMDALPLQELADVAFRSRVPGVMHACGHDGHTAVLISAARLLARLRDRLKGRVVFVFQPAEENLGGAKAMIDEGAFSGLGIEAALGLHLITLLPCGTVGLRPGPFMASVDLFRARILGEGGHGAMPGGSVDAIEIAAKVVSGLKAHLAGAITPGGRHLVNIGTIKGGTAPNIVADTVELEGTVRCMDDDARPALRQAMEAFLESVAKDASGSYELAYTDGYPILVNDHHMTDIVRRTAQDLLGEARVFELEPTMASEDMAFFLRMVPGCFFFVGAGFGDPAMDYPHHSPRFVLNEDSLLVALQVLCTAAVRFLEGA